MAPHLKLPGLWNYYKTDSKAFLGIIIIVFLSALTVKVDAAALGENCPSGQSDCTEPGQSCDSMQKCVCSSGYIEESGSCKKDHEQSCNISSSECHSALQCRNVNGTAYCLCNETSFWDSSNSSCLSKKDHEQLCTTGANECRTGLKCLPAYLNPGTTYCLCDQRSSANFWDAGSNICRLVDLLQVSNVQETITAMSVSLTWSINNNYGLSVKVGLEWNRGLRQEVISPEDRTGLNSGQQYPYSLVSYLDANMFYPERTSNAYVSTVTTKKDHTQECATAVNSNECRAGLQCLPGADDPSKSYCSCDQSSDMTFWDAGSNLCRSVDVLQVTTVQETSTADSVTLTWALSDTYGLDVKFGLQLSGGSRQEVTSPDVIPALNPGLAYSYTLVTYLSADKFYGERVSSPYSDSVTTKKDHEAQCSPGTNECRSGLQCLSGTSNAALTYCLCDQGSGLSFWDAGSNDCRLVELLKVTNIETFVSATSVRLMWSLNSTYGLSVKYGLRWNGGSRQDVTSPDDRTGLNPGQLYSYNIVTYLSGDEFYPERETSSATDSVRTAKDHEMQCDVAFNECRAGLRCQTGIGSTGTTYCLCDQTPGQMFWDAGSNVCRPVEDLKVLSVDETRTATSVILSWTSNTYGLPDVKFGLEWNGGTRQEVTSPEDQTGLNPGQLFSYTLVTYLSGDQFYLERATTAYSDSLRTKKDHEAQCSSGTNECRAGLQCLPGTGNSAPTYCLCDQGSGPSFWDAGSNVCRLVSVLSVSSVQEVKTTTSATLTWFLRETYGLSVKFGLAWNSGDREEVTSGKDFQGLTPGERYPYTFVTYLSGDSFYPERTTSPYTDSVTLIPAQPGAVNETASQLTSNPMKVVFGKSDGVVDSYSISVTPTDGGRPVVQSPTTNEAEFTLDNGQGYTYTISAVNPLGDRSDPRMGSFRTNAEPSSPVTSLAVGSVTARSATVTWRVPDEPNGDITAFVIKVLDKGMQCVQGINLMCSDCAGPRPSTATECQLNRNESDSFTAAEASRNSQHEFSYGIISLSPFKFYHVKVQAFNEKGAGDVQEQSFMTAEDRANDIIGVNMISGRDDQALQVYLDVALSPGEQTGTTNYTVTLTDVERASIVFTQVLNGFSNTTVRIPDLLAYHNYSASAFAETTVGRSPSTTESAIVRTRVNKPERATNLNIDPDDVIAVQFSFSFDCPSEDMRNGPIEMARVRKTSLANSAFEDFEFPRLTDCRWILSSHQLGSFSVSQNFSFSVILINRDVVSNPFTDLQSGATSDIYFYAFPKPPIFQPGTSLVQPPSQDMLTQTSIQLSLCGSCISDNSQGYITIAGLIICVRSGQNRCDTTSRRKRSTKTTDDYLTYATWAQSQAGGFQIPYRATPNDWLATNPSDSFTIGSNGNCATGVTVNSHCNGRLPSGKEIVIIVFSCTSGGCTESNPYISRTKATDDDDNVGLIVGIVVAIVIILVLVVLLIVFILRRRKPKRPEHIVISDYDTKEHRPIPIRRFKEKVAEFHSDSKLLFQADFEDIKALSSQLNVTTHEADREENRGKNRYVDILPFDHSRVKLQVQGEEGDASDYINANYIAGFNSVREYIATQGPIHSTVPHFWRMVWEQETTVIVMLSDLTENNKLKVCLYWPENLNEAVKYGEVLVEMTNFSQLNKYTIRNFRISFGQHSRRVTHFFIPGWSDFSANLTIHDVLEFAQLVRKEATPPNSGPVLVHCSAGVGRTGTFIALDYFMQYIDKHGLDADIDVFSFVMSMRRNRPRMVQAEAQYVFIFDALEEVIAQKLKAEEENLYENTKRDSDHIYANQTADTDHTYSNQAFVNDYDNVTVNPTTVL